MRPAAFLVVIMTAGLVALAGSPADPGGAWGHENLPDSTTSAAIVDQLQWDQPNQTFVAEATLLLEAAGYAVDYYPGDEVTVDFYRGLPSRGYDILILRTHSSAEPERDGSHDVVLFSNEEYSKLRHWYDLSMRRLASVIYDVEEYRETGVAWFGIRPQLVRDTYHGLDGAVVVMMGCQGLENPSMANVFLDAGATAYVGWDDAVTADRTDGATLAWLAAYLEEGSAARAVETAMDAVGPDAVYDSRLQLMTA